MVFDRLPRALGVVLGVAAGAIATRGARATTCGRVAEVRALPRPVQAPAPRNVRPRVTLPSNWRTSTLCRAYDFGDPPCPSPGTTLELELRVAGRSDPPLQIDVNEARSGSIATVEIVPRALLPGLTRFEIATVDRASTPARTLVATFTTGSGVDDVPPVLGRITRHERVGDWKDLLPTPAPQPKPKPSARPGVITLTDTTCDGAGVELYLASHATDDQTDANDLRYGIWISADPTSPLPYDTPPLAWLAGREGFARPSDPDKLVVTFGGSLPPNEFSWPARARSVKVGLRAVDLAGNRSNAVETTIAAQP